MTTEERFHRPNTLRLFPEWGGGMPIPRVGEISPGLRARLVEWNRVWQTELDPIFDANWSDPEIGRRWIAEGELLVRDLQLELGSAVRVVADFAGYDPDAPQTDP